MFKGESDACARFLDDSWAAVTGRKRTDSEAAAVHRATPKNDTAKSRQICIWHQTVAGTNRFLPVFQHRGTYWIGAFHASNFRRHDRPAAPLGD